MFSRTAVVTKAKTLGPSTLDQTNRLGFIPLLFLFAWCGLVAGLLEVGTIAINKRVFDTDHFFRMSRHVVWLIPLSNLCVFLALGLLACGVVLVSPDRGRWLVARGLAAIALLPSILVGFPRIYSLACLAVTLGLAVWLVPLAERHGRVFRRFVLATFPAAIAVVAIMGASLWVGELLEQRRENQHPLPPPGSPNVLLIVLDTVAAGHLSLHGYDRATSATLVELAERGIRFDFARAPSSWTLPSHATMFTGRWLHELSVGWVTPLDAMHPTLAGFLGEKGYATAGFIANTGYCAADSGLSRGFTRYHDFIFPEFTGLNTAALVSRTIEGVRMAVFRLEDRLRSAGLIPYVDRFVRALQADRKGAAVVNRELLGWLSNRAQAERPFFAFLNYNDAHYPYELPPGRLHRFGAAPTENDQRVLIGDWDKLDKTNVSPAGLAYVMACYDDCIADLDEQLGKLIDQLDRRGELDRTWLVITSDHGESFGEHPGNFCHGMSLYDTEVHVPLMIIPPGGRKTKQSVKEPVSLRDLSATIVDVTGQGAGSPFPGNSLAQFWRLPTPRAMAQPTSGSPSLSEVVPDPRNHDDDGAPRRRVPQSALKDAEWSYIRREGDLGEKLFRFREDPNEQNDLTGDPLARTRLERMRTELGRLTGGSLVPDRFGN